MATIKSFSDLQQSKKLAKILPLESEDLSWVSCDDGKQKYYQAENRKIILNYEKNHWLPCWSLAALLGAIPTMIGSIFEKDSLRLRIDKSGTDFNIWYENLDTGMVEEGFDIIETNPIDACYEMIIRLHELNLL